MNTLITTVEYLIKGIVSDSSSINISSQEIDGVMVITITASPEIIGQIIGKEGKIIKSIRTILNLSFPTVKYSLEIKD